MQSTDVEDIIILIVIRLITTFIFAKPPQTPFFCITVKLIESGDEFSMVMCLLGWPVIPLATVYVQLVLNMQRLCLVKAIPCFHRGPLICSLLSQLPGLAHATLLLEASIES